MINISRKCHPYASWLFGVSLIALLSGCGIEDMKNPFDSPRPEQILTGGRRAPVLNQDMPAPASIPAQKGNLHTNPFDYYDDHGNPRDAVPSAPVVMPKREVPAPAVSAPVAAKPTSDSTVVSRFFDSLTADSPSAASSSPQVRKPLPGNPQGFRKKEVSASAMSSDKPFPDAAVARWEPAPEAKPEVKTIASEPEKMDEKSAPLPVIKNEQEPKPFVRVTPPEVKESLPVEKVNLPPAVNSDGPAFPDDAIVRWREGDGMPKPAMTKISSKTPKTVDVMPQDAPVVLGTKVEPSPVPVSEAPLERDYPALSSVPETPAQFKAVRKYNDENLNSLQQDYDSAQDTKKSLDSEPSTQRITTVPKLDLEKNKKPLLGGENAPPPPFSDELPAPAAAEAPKGNSSWWDRVFSSDGSSESEEEPLSTPTNVNANQPKPSTLPSPELLHQYPPRKTTAQ